MPILHAVPIRFLDDVSQEDRDEILERYQKITDECGGKDAGILYCKVEKNLYPDKCDLAAVVVFEDEKAMRVFGEHPKHAALTQRLGELATWRSMDLPVSWPMGS